MSEFNRYEAAHQARNEADGLLLVLTQIADAAHVGELPEGTEFALRGIVRRLDRLVLVLWAANGANGKEVMDDDGISRVVYGVGIPKEVA